MNAFLRFSLYSMLFLSLTSAHAFIMPSQNMDASQPHSTAPQSTVRQPTAPQAAPASQQSPKAQSHAKQSLPQQPQAAKPQAKQLLPAQSQPVAKAQASKQTAVQPTAAAPAIVPVSDETIAEMDQDLSPIRMEIYKDGPLVLGQPTSIVAYIYDKEGGIDANQLSPAPHNHFRLTLIDPSLASMLSLYPVATDNHGYYKFNMTFLKPGEYMLLGEITDAQGNVYAPTGSLKLPGNPQLISKSSHIEPGTIEKHQTINDLQFSATTTSKKIHAKQLVILDITAKHMTGEFHKGLEPHMNQYAHLIGINEQKTVIFHEDPINRAPTSSKQRGGPDVRFKLRFPEAGFYRLWVQFQVDGKPVLVPYDLEVLP